MGFASKLQRSASNLIAKFGDGMTVTFSRSAGFYTGSTGSSTTAYTASTMAPITWTANAVAVEYSEREVDGTTIQRGDRKLLVTALGLDSDQIPTKDDRVTIAGEEHSIVYVVPVQPGETPIYIELQVRR